MGKTLTVRQVDEVLVQRLKLRAALHGHSTEAEHRLLLRQALSDDESVKDFWAEAAKLRAKTRSVKHTPAEELVRATRRER